MYPYFTVNKLPDFDLFNLNLWLLFGFEFICFVNIVINFFLQEIDEDGGSKQNALAEVATNYFKGQFRMDLFIFVPWGLLFCYFDERLKIFWVTKGFRIISLNHYLSDQMLLPVIK